MGSVVKRKVGVDTRVLFLVAMMSALLIISAIQTVELVNLKNKFSSLEGVDVTQEKKLSAGPGSADQEDSNLLQRNLQNLPGMVGGC